MHTTNTLVSTMTLDQLERGTFGSYQYNLRYKDAKYLGIDLDRLADCAPEGDVSRYTVYQPAGFVRGEIITADGYAVPFEISLGAYDAPHDVDAREYAQARATDQWAFVIEDIDLQSVYLDFSAVELLRRA